VGELLRVGGEALAGVDGNRMTGPGCRVLSGGAPTPERPAAAMPQKRPPVTVEQILRWADDHRARTGSYPSARAGGVLAAPGETWMGLDNALRFGLGGALPGGDSLSRLLLRERGKPRHGRPRKPRGLRPQLVMRWARAHRRRVGAWPTRASGPVAEAPEVTWAEIDRALRKGTRGLPGGDTLAKLLRREVGVLATPGSGAGVAEGKPGRDHRRGRPNEARRREVLALRAEGLTLQEIGDRLGCTRQNVSLLLRAARQALTGGR
jgi:Sigma-70, region 4